MYVLYNVGLRFCLCIRPKVFGEKSVIKHSDAHDYNNTTWRESYNGNRTSTVVLAAAVAGIGRAGENVTDKGFCVGSFPILRVHRKDHRRRTTFGVIAADACSGIATLRRSGARRRKSFRAEGSKYVRTRI